MRPFRFLQFVFFSVWRSVDLKDFSDRLVTQPPARHTPQRSGCLQQFARRPCGQLWPTPERAHPQIS
jgi:hypothetical protein